MISAVIISDDKRFLTMLDIELSLMGIEAVSSESADTDGVSLVLADIDFCAERGITSLNNGGIFSVGFYAREESLYADVSGECSRILRRPFLMSELRAILAEKYAFGKDDLIASGLPKNDLYRPKKNIAADNILSLDEKSSSAIYGDRTVKLSDYEYKVLALLVSNRGETVPRETISEQIGGEGNMPEVYICHLRRKIDNALGIKCIYTVRGKGYTVK